MRITEVVVYSPPSSIEGPTSKFVFRDPQDPDVLYAFSNDAAVSVLTKRRQGWEAIEVWSEKHGASVRYFVEWRLTNGT